MNLIRTVLLSLFQAACLPLPMSGALTVHMVPHTHDDVGWLKTVDQYFTGLYGFGYVDLILDTVIRALLDNPDRRFTYVEQAFLERWWRRQSLQMQNLTRGLVSAGRLEISNGGWCMHDEAAAYYLDMVDQTTHGHRFLMDEFGVAPSTGWQLDPFGHSAMQAALLSAEVGFNGLFFGRLDYQDLGRRVNRSEAEFIWRASPSLGSGAQVFTGLTGEYGGNYGPPGAFDWGNRGQPVQDDPSLEDYNVQSRVDEFVYLATWQGNHTRGNHVLWTMGSDFQYENAFRWFENMDKIIKYVNLDGRVKARYSTPAEYVRAKAQEANTSWPLKGADDFFPYADGPHQFWTGYFTSRPALKRYVRQSSAVLQVVRQIAAMHQLLGLESNLSSRAADAIQQLARAMGVNQHHDAITGTSKQHVADDYARRLAAGTAAAVPAVAATLAAVCGAGGAEFSMCGLRNVSVCAPTQNMADGQTSGSLDFIVWNGLAQARSELVELPAGSHGVSVSQIGYGGGEVPLQLVPSLPSVTNYNASANGSNTTALFFAELPPLGFAAYRLRSKATGGGEPPHHGPQQTGVVVLENEHLKLEFVDGELNSMQDKAKNLYMKVNQSWLWYNSSVGNKESSQASGAYIFRPNSSDTLRVSSEAPTLTVVRGKLVDEVHQTYWPSNRSLGPWVSQRVRLARGARHVEITYTVGPIPVDDGLGKEVISRFTTDIANAGECFTDSNGREMLARRRDYRPTWVLNQTEPVAGNYYPITASIFIKDARRQLTVLTDASHGGSGCVRDGELELMVHRRLLRDDGRGVSEPLNEELDPPFGSQYGAGLVVRGRHLLVLAPPGAAASIWRPLADGLYMPPTPFFTSPGANIMLAERSALQRVLPANLQMVSLEQWDDERVLLRLAHQFGLDEDAELSKPAQVDLATLFADVEVRSVEERGLAGTISRQEVLDRRVAWRVDGENATQARLAEAPPAVQADGRLVYSFGPLQIRTFLLQLASRGSVVV